MANQRLQKLVLSSLFLALTFVLPFITGQIPEIGSALLPMHLPVLLCGFICGWPYGLAIGFVAPILRSLLWGMPPLFPIAIAMAFEMATYGFCTGFFYSKWKSNTKFIFPTLIISMIIGRIVWGIVCFPLYTLFTENSFSLSLFWTSGFVLALPGIILQLILVPIIIASLSRIKVLFNDKKH